ncbi:sulfotransferase family protein [Bradyrhizobium sp. ORS 86]|uniref:nodulation protein NoeE n=1 Tax=Bradyrhizobium sp. ORS 86 TaxID=1685970 RepID=UPI00388E6935
MSRDVNCAPAVCFLLGLPRSGTTLLAHLLQQHPDIAAPPEPWLMLALEAFGRLRHGHPAGSSLIEAAASEFLGRIDRNMVSRAFADAAYGQYLAAAGKRIIIDKTPRYWMVLEFLDALYPDAPQILLMRNPYAIAASLKSTWGIPLQAENTRSVSVSSLADLMLRLPDGIASALADLVLGLPRLAAHRARLQTQVVQYELLVARPEQEIQRLVAGLGCEPISIGATMEQAGYLLSSSFGDRKILERRTIDGGSVHAWQAQLSIEEMQTVTDLVGAELMIKLGYEEELRHAQQAGIVDKGRDVTELYRRIFRIWWDLRTSSGFPTNAGELTSVARQASDNACSPESQQTPETIVEASARLEAAMAAPLRNALSASEAARGTQVEAIRDRDATIAALRAEIVRLEQSLKGIER